MASAADIAILRTMINQPQNAEPWTDETLGLIIDASSSLDDAAAKVWEGKAASVAHLVDISEGGSSRKMGDLHEQYLKMADLFTEKANPGGATGVRQSMTREIARA